MNKGCKKIFISTLLLSLTLGFNTVFGADAYKNSLLKVELLKKTSGDYSINLYTQKRYQEPVKVIKKSDYSYYILLPETKNSAIKTSAPSGDIRNVSISLHPYAGQDVSSGYTKININTTKPINFELDVKQLSQSSTPKQTITAQVNNPSQANQALQNISLAKETASKEAQKSALSEQTAQNSQKKNSDSSQDSKKITLAQPQSTQTQKTQNTKQALLPPKPSQNNSKSNTQKTAPKQKITPLQKPRQNTQKLAVIPTKTTAAAKPETKTAPLPLSSESLNFAVKQGEEKQISKPAPKLDTVKQKPVIQEENIDNKINEELNSVESSNENLENSSINNDKKLKIKFENSLNKFKRNIKKIPVYLEKIKTALAAKLDSKGLNFVDFALILGSFLTAFLLILFLLTKKQSAPVKIRKREELLEDAEIKKENQTNEEPQKAEFFVFDENVKQTRLQADNSNKNFELSSFEPDKNYAYDSSNEYEIIQKILKEDSSIEIEPPAKYKEEERKEIKDALESKETQTQQEPENKEESFEILVKEAQTIKNSEKQEKEEQKIQQERPKVLSSVEIAPQRGFMCVLYNNNINLMGYIFDDVFALHNFKREKLNNYDIKFRLSDKDDKGANFIVKIDDSKMVIRATKLKMTKEVLM